MKSFSKIFISVIKHFIIFPLRAIKKNIFFIYRFFLPNILAFYKKRIVYKNKPICSQKVFITGSGRISIGLNCYLGYKLGGQVRACGIELQARTEHAQIRIGDNVLSNNNLFICSSNYIEIGQNTLIGQQVTIMDFEAHGIAPDKRKTIGEIGNVIIGENVWIGNNVTILKNSEIGKNTIVATGSIVSGKFPENVIIGGIPAKIIKELPK